MQKIIYLTPPSISEHHIKEKICCIRPHRERIFQVYKEIRQGKLLIHNYGHGGAGWTFLFGAVHEAIRIFEQAVEEDKGFKKQKICVVGAGCYGLLTAVLLARKGYLVSIVAKEINDIPSNKAAGFFFPRHRKCSNEQEIAVFTRLGHESYDSYLHIIHREHPFIYEGARLLPAYYALDIDPGFGSYSAQGLLKMPRRVTIDFNNGKSYDVMEYKTVFIDTQAIMKELHRNIRELGIAIVNSEIETFDELEEAIIFNCAGMGAKKLVGDKRIIPVQGHLITLKNQPPREELQYMINVKVTMKNLKGMPRDELIYYAPKQEGILGITFLRGQDSLTANQHEFDRLLERCQLFFNT